LLNVKFYKVIMNTSYCLHHYSFTWGQWGKMSCFSQRPAMSPTPVQRMYCTHPITESWTTGNIWNVTPNNLLWFGILPQL